MTTRNIFFAMILSSVLGGAIAIGGYSLIAPAPGIVVPANNDDPSNVSFTNYVFDSTDFVVPEGLNFVYAAKAIGFCE